MKFEINDVVLKDARRIVQPYSWVGHIPFAFWLIDELRPRLFVELGTHTGNSYFAFCQAVEDAGSGTKCFAVDTWQGDEHAGIYGDEVFRDVNEYNNSHYSDFSTLCRMTFEEALPQFSDGSIDLLHIDGLHTYDAVKHDFETWLPKMSSRGVVIFHDTCVRQADFGVWKYWAELMDKYKGFEFKHSNGLGVLAVSAEAEAAIEKFIEHDGDGLNPYARLISTVGDAILNNLSLQSPAEMQRAYDEKLSEKDVIIQHLNGQVDEMQSELAIKEQDLQSILDSNSWKLTSGLRWIGHKVRALFRPSRLIRRRIIGVIGRKLFRSLPLSVKTRRKLKHQAFRYAGFLFSHDAAYQFWLESEQFRKAGGDSARGLQTAGRAQTGLSGKNLLIIDAVTPTPDRDSGSLDVYYFMKVFIELGYNITFIPDDLQTLGIYTEQLRQLGVNCLTSEDIVSIDRYLQEHGREIDVALLYRVYPSIYHASTLKKYAPQAKIIFDTVDLHFLREQRQAALTGGMRDRKEASRTKEAEFDMMAIADATIVLSDSEKELVLKEEPGFNIFTVPYIREVVGSRNDFSSRKDIVFIGGYRHAPNIDAIKYFVNRIWPIVKKTLKDTRLLVLGSSPTEEVMALDSDVAGVEVIGYVENIDEYFDNCRLSIAPLRYGAGIKGKIGTSAAYGMPCVATSIAVEGMGLEHNREVLIADSPVDFAKSVISLYQDEDLWNKISQNSLDFMVRNYSYDAGKARLRRLLSSLRTGLKAKEILRVNEITSLDDYRSYQSRLQDEYGRRLLREKQLIGDERGFSIKGYCAVCGRPSSFHGDFDYAFVDENGTRSPNWRERLVCGGCHLNNRVRASIHLFHQECGPVSSSDIYITEQTTDLYAWMKERYPNAVGSEFLDNKRDFGSFDGRGIRNESLTGLSFPEESFDYILTFDVLEHIPDYKKAISEMARVLRPGGQVLFSVPFAFESGQHIVRAKINQDGEVEHLMEPEYHGDPINSDGCLCFYHFGWRLLDEFRAAGFDSVKAMFYWSEEFGYLGMDQALFMATKKEKVH